MKYQSLEISGLEELILLTLLRQDCYGLQIRDLIHEASQNQRSLGVGSLYPTLQKLKKRGMVDDYWGEEVPENRRGARRKYYKITELGKLAIFEVRRFRERLEFGF